MSRRKKQHDQEFKQNAVKYYLEHPDLTQEDCAKNLGIGLSTLSHWIKQYRETNGEIPTRGSGNYASDEQKEIARLKRELRDTQDALDVLKKTIDPFTITRRISSFSIKLRFQSEDILLPLTDFLL